MELLKEDSYWEEQVRKRFRSKRKRVKTRKLGKNPRRKGTNPRAKRKNPRILKVDIEEMKRQEKFLKDLSTSDIS